MNSVPMQVRQECTDNEFCKSYEIPEIRVFRTVFNLKSIGKKFTVLDRKVGKRSLGKLKETMVEQNEWLQSSIS